VIFLETGGILLDKGRSGGCPTEIGAFDADAQGLKSGSTAMPQLAAVRPVRKKNLKTRFVLKTSRTLQIAHIPIAWGQPGNSFVETSG
jgi:hypothetical protein